MTTLIIQNNGLIEAGDLTLIGSSTKRDDDDKIGMYGSGNKYALAWFLRNNIDIRIFSGQKEIMLSHEIIEHRKRQVAVLTVDKKQTSITSEMGPEWTGWMALREIISNAIDEGGYEITTAFNSEINGIEDKTTISIPLNNELNKVVMNYDYYFAFDRKYDFKNEIGKVYIKSERDYQNIYRKGIKCYDEKENETYLDYNFNDIKISESRVCDSHSKNVAIKSLISKGVTSKVLKWAIMDGTLPSYFNNNLLDPITELVNQGCTFTTKKIQKLLGSLFTDVDALLIPEDWYDTLRKKGLIKSPFKHEGVDFVEDHTYDCSEIKYLLMTLGIENIDVLVGKFDSYANIATNNDKSIFFINESCKDKSPKELASLVIQKMDSVYLSEKLFN